MNLQEAMSIADSHPPLIGSDKVREALDRHGAELLQEGIVDVLRKLTDRTRMVIRGVAEMTELLGLLTEAEIILGKAEDVEVK